MAEPRRERATEQRAHVVDVPGVTAASGAARHLDLRRDEEVHAVVRVREGLGDGDVPRPQRAEEATLPRSLAAPRTARETWSVG